MNKFSGNLVSARHHLHKHQVNHIITNSQYYLLKQYNDFDLGEYYNNGQHNKLITFCKDHTVLDHFYKHVNDVNLQNSLGKIPLHYVQYLPENTSCKLIDYGSNVNLYDFDGLTPLHYASIHCQSYLIKYLVNNKANVESPTLDGYACRPIHFIAMRQEPYNLDLLRYMMDIGCDMYSKTTDDWTMAHYLHLYGSISVIKYMRGCLDTSGKTSEGYYVDDLLELNNRVSENDKNVLLKK